MKKLCAAKCAFGEVPKGAVGIVEQSNGTATVLFIGAGQVKTVDAQDIEYIDANKTGDDYPKKICNVCHLLKSTEEFDRNQSNKKKKIIRRPSCRECRVKIEGVPLSTKEKRRLDKEKPTSDQIFECPICRKRCIPWVTANLVRDHDHKTGAARMWICDSCNTGLGRFKDSTKLLEDAIAYLLMFEEKNDE